MISKNTCLMGDGVYINPAYHLVPLSKLRIEKLNRLWYLHIITDSKPMIFHIGPEFKKSFCKFLHVSTKATKNIPFDVLLETMKENNSFDVKVYVNKGRALALAIMKAEHMPLGADGALELYEWLKYHGYDVRDLLQDEFFTEFSIFNKNPFDLDGFHSYRGGGLIHVSHVGNSSVKILTTLEHRNSRNYAIINNKSLCLYVPTRKKQPG